jgi:hypothetical protein
MKILRFGLWRTYRLVGFKGLFYALRSGWKKIREGAHELDGARGFLRAARKDWYMWASVGMAIAYQSFWLMAVIAVCAMFGATTREWSQEGYKKMLDGYGTMVDQQQIIIRGYQTEHLHPSEKAARARLN